MSPIGIAGDNTEYRPGDDFWVSSGLFLGLVAFGGNGTSVLGLALIVMLALT